MKRLLFVLAALAISAAAASADVTVTMSVSIGAAQGGAGGTQVYYVKGTKFRADTDMAGQRLTALSDTATRQQWTINHATRQIEPFDAAAALAGLPVSFGDAKSSVTPNGQTREILGRTCHGYTVEVIIPMSLGGETVLVRMSGPTWVAREGAGVAEFKAAQKALTEIGLSTSVMGQGPQAKAIGEINKTLADAGVVMEQTFQMTMEGAGQMAQVMAQAGSMTITTTVTAISTDSIPDATFALPEGYAKK